jgi:DNA-binding CsgD family transcriptional regulator
MTKKEVLTKAIAMNGFTAEEKEVLQRMIDGLVKKSSKPTKAQIENEGYKADIVAILDENPKTAREIAELIGLSTNKVAALLRAIDCVEKIPGAKSKDAPKYIKVEFNGAEEPTE